MEERDKIIVETGPGRRLAHMLLFYMGQVNCYGWCEC